MTTYHRGKASGQDPAGSSDVDELRASLPSQLSNCADFWEGFGHVHEAPDGARWFRSGIPLPEINGIRRPTTLDLAATATRARQALEGVPWSWWISEGDDASNEQELHDLGFETVERMPHLAIPTDVATAPPPSGLRIRAIEKEDELDEFVAVWAGNFGIPTDCIDALSGREHDRPGREEQCTYLAGWIEGRMVATTLLLTTHEVAGIYCVTTDPRLRRRGAGRAMTSAAIEAARERDLRVACLQATPDGLPLYRSMGFEEIASYAILAPTRTSAPA